ncbi:class II fructose-bisphosphatase [Magnetospirillum sulfuroxidans]|uniref:Fructose-1,6-bisphosphatase n=1 Tax=Magnetospirillum sulfuroxidans TaxID=611300 RepID=A0ABS5I9S7_9PROT|nr:class II fructose-bisphosphatase [Magnetospirillum sulfuroxidans]MBR9971181.1 class II fructose-bisphosphatase [Magnetospirillum sulfuroxidans]
MPNRVFVPPPHALDRNLALEVVRVTEASALAASRWVGRGDEKAADEAATAAMREALNSLSMEGRVVNGGGGATLANGDKVGTGTGPKVDIVLTPIEGATICAKGSHNAISVIAATQEGSFLHVPADAYMEKLAIGPGLPTGIIDLSVSPEDNLINVAAAKGVAVADLTVCMLDRPRHGDLLGRIYEAGARVVLIDDGDVSGAIAVGLLQTGIDLYMGSGGAAEGVLAAAGLKCLGGQMQCRLLLRSEDDRAKARAAGIRDIQAQWTIDDMVKGEVMFAATGITDGNILAGIRLRQGGAVSHSLVMRSTTGTLRTMTSQHDFSRHAQLHRD